MIRLEEVLKEVEEETKIPVATRERLWTNIIKQLVKKNIIKKNKTHYNIYQKKRRYLWLQKK